MKLKKKSPPLIQQLVNIWEKSVRATHLFLSDKEIAAITQYVPQTLNEISHPVLTENENKLSIAFMGTAGRRLEMLFISSRKRGKGTEKKLVNYEIETYSVNELGCE